MPGTATGNRWTVHRSHQKREPGSLLTLWCSRYLSSRGSDASAAGGRYSELSEWLRSIADDGAPAPRKISGTATGSPPSIVMRSMTLFVIAYIKESLTRLSEAFVFALPIFPGSRPPSIVGVHVLNFCVRDGNRWTHMTINTNYSFIYPSSYKLR